MYAQRKAGLGAGRVWFVVLASVVLASCERTPSKSDYVSAQVTAMYQGQSSDDLQACRLAVIRQFSNVPLEDMKRRSPEPEPRFRPSCSL